MILVLGAGRKKFGGAVTLDRDRSLGTDIVCNLGVDCIPIDSDICELVIAIHVLEHIGKFGETREWFQFWEEIYRVMKPDSMLQFESPKWNSVWAWADPSHVRVISPETFAFLDQNNYSDQQSIISPFRIKCDMILTEAHDLDANFFAGTLQARKPLKTWWY